MRYPLLPVVVAAAITASGALAPPNATPAVAAVACTCMSPKRPACEVWWQTSAIFVGRVTRTRTVQDETADGTRTRKVATMRVSESFSGLPRREREVEVRTGSGGGDCGFDFERNRSYLVYASRSARTGQLETGICTRTALVEEAAEDLAYLRGLEEAAQVISVYGLVYRDRQISDSGAQQERALDPGGALAGTAVLLRGEGLELATTTDDEGWYEYDGLPPGAYELRVTAPGVSDADVWGLRLPLAPACIWYDITVPPLPLDKRTPGTPERPSLPR